MLKVGERAPDFHALSTAGAEVSLGDFKGKKLVLYFYPKAFTPFCTAEARRTCSGKPDAIQARGKSSHSAPYDAKSRNTARPTPFEKSPLRIQSPR